MACRIQTAWFVFASRAREWRWPVALAAIVVVLGVAFELVAHPTAQRLHLGAEYFHVARALADGRGFSDPFGEQTGPTAWMPPLLPGVMAVMLLLFGSKNAVASGISVLMVLSLVVQGISVHLIARRCLRSLPAWSATALFLLWILTFNYWFFLLTSDIWLLCLPVSFLTLLLTDHLLTGRIRPLLWGALGGFGALASPTFGVAWGCLVAFLLLRSPGARGRWLKALVLAGALCSPWVVRNALVFHELIPTKSNLAFEAYQANVVDSDGVYEISSMIAHPYNTESLRLEYQARGEIGFIRHYGARFQQQLRRRPAAVLRRVANRAFAATLNYVPLSEKMDSPLRSTLLHAVYALPFVTLLASITLAGPHRRMLRFFAFFWFCYLLPYVVVAFYARYFLPLTPLLLLMTLLGMDQLAWGWSQRRVAFRGQGFLRQEPSV